ncbi:MAG: penicillin-binding protein 2 [Candidatus Pacebacteria bacterium]|nr:penicillin-binding protein 2 [Candidatus Paceibacterota bacterium]
MKQGFNRLSMLSVLFFAFTLILIGRLYFLQIVYGQDFSDRADRQYVHPTETLFDRGTIFFKYKDGLLLSAAMLKTGFTVAITPKLIEDPEATYTALSSLFPLDQEDFFARVAKKDDPYEKIAGRIEESVGNQIEALKLPGVILTRERWRFYPSGSLGAHLLGLVGYKEDTLAGRYGLERYYDEVLGRAGGNLYVNFFAEIFGNIKEKIIDHKESEGDIIATIEPAVQGFLEGQLEEINETWFPEHIGGIIINPENGEIYAMASLPTFDPNSFGLEKGISVFSNPLVENVYEMGSIVKALTMAAGLDSQAVTPDTFYEDRGSVVIEGATISNYDGKAHGWVDMHEVLNESLNTGAVFVVSQMGNKTFADYMKKFKVDEETGVDLPNETYGLVENLNSPRDIEYATASFGQGIAFTPIATVRAISALGNGGYLIDPHIVKKINYRSGLSKTIHIDKGKQILKKETSEEITRMLVKVVDEALLEGTVALPHYSIAAKTGTAQVAKEEGGGYYKNVYLHSFFGYFPAYNPQFLVFFYLMYPKEVRYASQTLTHPFIDTAKFLINYYEVPPDR